MVLCDISIVYSRSGNNSIIRILPLGSARQFTGAIELPTMDFAIKIIEYIKDASGETIKGFAADHSSLESLFPYKVQMEYSADVLPSLQKYLAANGFKENEC
jgi:hypothetical protein